MAGLYAADGSFNVTVVDGTDWVGLYAADGSWNVIAVDGTEYVGVYDASGALNVYVSDGTYRGWYHPSGAWNVAESPYVTGVSKVTPVGGTSFGPQITLSNNTVAEDFASGGTVGALSVINGAGVYTFTITLDADNKFAIDGSNLETDASLDYETATSHSVTIEADNGVDDPITRIFTITVTDVSEGGGSGPSVGDGLLLEDGTFFLLLETGDFLLLE
jgi:hypothetical protein